jgi:transcriptional antiterminator RfaH
LGLTTSELSELRLSTDALAIERQGFKLFYYLHGVRTFEQHETLKVIERVLASERPLVLLRQMAIASGLSRLRIAGQLIQPVKAVRAGAEVGQINAVRAATAVSRAETPMRQSAGGETDKLPVELLPPPLTPPPPQSPHKPDTESASNVDRLSQKIETDRDVGTIRGVQAGAIDNTETESFASRATNSGCIDTAHVISADRDQNNHHNSHRNSHCDSHHDSNHHSHLQSERASLSALNGSHLWYVVHTKPRQEVLALENLERQGYCCYLPKFRSKRAMASKLIVIDEPMFPRYLFIGVDQLFETKGSSPIRSTRGVHELVRFGSQPAQIDFELLNAIYEREVAQERQPNNPFKVGDRVKVVNGPLAGIESIYQAKSGEERSMILLRLLNRPVTVKVSTAQLRRAG